MGDASKNFNWRDFACPCCFANDTSYLLVRSIQRARDNLGGRIWVNSGFRCLKHNADVGGARNSQHLKGRAVDAKPMDNSLQELLDAILAVPDFEHGGIGIYRTFIHADVRGHRARWGRIGKRYVPWTVALKHYGLVDRTSSRD